MAKTKRAKIFEASISLDVSSANERTRYERSFRRRRRAETATRRETARRALFEATSARSSTVCGCLPSVRVSSLALVSKSALAKEKERAVNFGSSRKSAHSARESADRKRGDDLLRSRKENRSVENVPPESDIALGFSCCFVRAKFPPAQTDEPYKIEYSVLFFFERSAAAKRARSPSSRARAPPLLRFFGGRRGHNFTRLAGRAP